MSRSREHEQLVKLGQRYEAKKKELETAELESTRLYELIKELQEQIKYKDGQIDALKYAVGVLVDNAADRPRLTMG